MPRRCEGVQLRGAHGGRGEPGTGLSCPEKHAPRSAFPAAMAGRLRGVELADSIREIAAGHILPDSPLGKALDRVAGAVDELERRVKTLEGDVRKRKLFERTESAQ